MTPTEILKEEHKIVLSILDAAERTADSIRSAGAFPAEDVEKMLDFFRGFVDRCHHAKEEKQLFVKMMDKGMSEESGPLAVMLYEHEEGRSLVRRIADSLAKARAGDKEAGRAVADALSAYSALLRSHIDKEDNVLYTIADEILDAVDQKELEKAFEKIEAEEIGAGIHEKYHALAHELAHSH
jgi:hemerythrin-like domain-containing protein